MGENWTAASARGAKEGRVANRERVNRSPKSDDARRRVCRHKFEAAPSAALALLSKRREEEEPSPTPWNALRCGSVLERRHEAVTPARSTRRTQERGKQGAKFHFSRGNGRRTPSGTNGVIYVPRLLAEGEKIRVGPTKTTFGRRGRVTSRTIWFTFSRDSSRGMQGAARR